MAVLKHLFVVLTAVGMWEPENLRAVLKFLYVFYAFFIGFVNASCVFLEFTYVFRYQGSFENINEGLYITLTGVLLNIKFVKMTMDRAKLGELAKMLKHGFSKRRNELEVKMEKKCERYINWLTAIILAILFDTVIMLETSPFYHTTKSNRPLQLTAWSPYLSEGTYWYYYVYFSLAIFYGASTTGCYDLLLYGFLIRTSEQFDVLIGRLREIERVRDRIRTKESDENFVEQSQREIFKDCIQHHNYIYELIKKVEVTFEVGICCEFVLCGMVISLSIYKLSMNPGTDLVLLTTLQYLVYTLTQLFMYCFFGNQLTQKSLSLSREIYKINWLRLSKTNSQMLLIMMLRAQRPVIMSGGHFFHLKLETFLKILKATYSVYNCLVISTKK